MSRNEKENKMTTTKLAAVLLVLSALSFNATAATFSSRMARVDAMYKTLSAKLKVKYGIDPKSDPVYRKVSALTNSTLIYNKLANSIKYDHGYAVNAIYRGYYPYTTRAIKGSSYVSTAALARSQLTAVKAIKWNAGGFKVW